MLTSSMGSNMIQGTKKHYRTKVYRLEICYSLFDLHLLGFIQWLGKELYIDIVTCIYFCILVHAFIQLHIFLYAPNTMH